MLEAFAPVPVALPGNVVSGLEMRTDHFVMVLLQHCITIADYILSPPTPFSCILFFTGRQPTSSRVYRARCR